VELHVELTTLLLDLLWSMVFRKLSCALPVEVSETDFVGESFLLDFPVLSLLSLPPLAAGSEQMTSRWERRREKREGESGEEDGETSDTV
jgi:hypothetical protein